METQSQKRITALFIPYTLENGVIKIFLQKRSLIVKRIPGYFGFWGGHAEDNETPEENLKREVKEELNVDIDLNDVVFFNKYEFLRKIKYTFLFKTTESWSETVTVEKEEGDYGQWFTTEEALNLDKFIFEDKMIVTDLERVLLDKPIR